MKIKLLILSIVAFVALFGCEEKLDIENPNAPTRDVFFRNTDDAVKSANAIYSRLTNASLHRWMPWLGNLRADLMKSNAVGLHMVNNYDLFAISNYNYGQFTSIWKGLYVIIYRANQTLDNVPDIEIDAENSEQLALKERVLGEAYFLRGWAYYHLALYWGNVPFMLETSQPTDKPSSSTQEEVFQQAARDFEVAFEKLWTKDDYFSNNPDENVGRATKGAAQAMLGKVLMQLGDYEEAQNALEWMVEGEGAQYYDLVSNYRHNFLEATENNAESVFEIQAEYNDAQSHGNDLVNPDEYNYGLSTPRFYAPRVNGIGFASLEMNRWVVDEFQEEQTTEGERDPRVEASFLYSHTDPRGPQYTMCYGETWISRFPFPNGTDHRRILLRKFLNDATQNYEDFASPNNYRYLRYSDVLLLYAECLNELGQTGDAYQWVNRVRNRAGLPNLQDAHPEIGNDQDLFLEQLKHERITELAGEGHRWADLARWDDLSPDLASRDEGFNNFEEGKHELLPIPSEEIDFNPNLEQNPGW